MEVFIEFTDRDLRSRVLARFESLGLIGMQANRGMQVWFKPFDDERYDEFTDWLEAEGIDYENI